jgi:hypothetical protein
MLERLNSWSDGGVAQAFRTEDLIRNLMLYIATGRIESSLWFYRSFLLECHGRTPLAGRGSHRHSRVPEGDAQR